MLILVPIDTLTTVNYFDSSYHNRTRYLSAQLQDHHLLHKRKNIITSTDRNKKTHDHATTLKHDHWCRFKWTELSL